MIDVIIPAYNCTKTIKKTMASLVAQTDNRFRVIIVDDCSTENITTIIEECAGHLNLEYIRNKENIGCGMSRQVGIDHGKSSHFCFLDSDDMFMPYTVEIFNSVIESNPDLGLLCGYFYEQATIDTKHSLVMRKDGFTWCHGKLYNAAKVKQYGIYNRPDVKYADDSFFNSMCFELLDAQKIELPLYLYSNNPMSVTRCENAQRDSEVAVDFLNAMLHSCEIVLRYKSHVDHLPYTLDMVKRMGKMTKEAWELYEELEKINRQSDINA